MIVAIYVSICFTAKGRLPEFRFNEEVHNFGKISQARSVTANFKFMNIGDEPLVISSVDPTCGCTVAKFTNDPVMKGRAGVITLIFDAATAGVFSKQVIVKSNAKTAVVILYIKGEVVPMAKGN